MKHSLSAAADVREYLATVYNISDGPEDMDLENAMTGILNTQFVHDLQSEDVSP